MKRCIIRINAAAVAQLLGLPEGAVVESVREDPLVVGELQLRVTGFGRETQPGETLPTALVIAHNVVVDGQVYDRRSVSCPGAPSEPLALEDRAGAIKAGFDEWVREEQEKARQRQRQRSEQWAVSGGSPVGI